MDLFLLFQILLDFTFLEFFCNYTAVCLILLTFVISVTSQKCVTRLTFYLVQVI